MTAVLFSGVVFVSPFIAFAVTPANLITNPSLESVSGTIPEAWNSGGWGTNGRVFIYPVAGFDGEKAVQINMPTYNGGDAKWIPRDVPVIPGKTYNFSNMYQSIATTSVVIRYTSTANTLSYVTLSTKIPPSATWKPTSLNFSVPAGATSVSVWHVLNRVGTLTTDLYSIVDTGATDVDITRPTVTVTSPMANTTVFGTTNISASASDNIAVSRVQFLLDGANLGPPDTTAPFGISWDTLVSTNGPHSLGAKATDAEGNTAVNSIKVTVSNQGGTTTNPNLIENPSFENTDVAGLPASWQKSTWGTNNAILSYPVSGFGTPHGAEVEITAYTNGDAKWYFTPIPVVAGQRYQFSDYYKSNAPTEVVAEYTLTDGTYSYERLSGVSASDSWTTHSAEFIPPPGASYATIFHSLISTGTLAVDEFSVFSLAGIPDPDLFSSGMVSLTFDDGWLSHYVSAVPILNAARMKGSFEIISLETLDSLPMNDISNPSLEESDELGNPANWQDGGWGTNDAVFAYPVAGQSSAKAAKVTINNHTDGDAKWFFDDVTVVDGAAYYISDFYMSDVTTKVTVRYNMGNGVYEYADVATLPPSATWKKFTKQIVVPVNVESFTFFHRLDRVGSLTIDNANFTDLELYVTPEQVLAMQARGHEIGSHSRTHPSLTSILPAEMQTEITDSRSDLLNMGVTSVGVFVYPYGDHNEESKRIAADAGYIGARAVAWGFNTKSSDKYALKVQQIDVTTTVAQVKAWVNTAILNKTWLILMFHEIDNSGGELSMTPANFQQTVNYLKSNKVPVVTMSEGILQMD